MTLHQQRTHPSFVEGCWACQIGTVAVAPSATPSRRGGQFAADTTATENRWSREHAAYKRLVRQGYQPATLNRCDEVEKHAQGRADIEIGLGASKVLGVDDAA